MADLGVTSTYLASITQDEVVAAVHQRSAMGDAIEVGVRCGRCGGNVFMATCHHFRGTGHEWVLVGICMVCRMTAWSDDGCLDCKEAADG